MIFNNTKAIKNTFTTILWQVYNKMLVQKESINCFDKYEKEEEEICSYHIGLTII
jgi:hypothetical protein